MIVEEKYTDEEVERIRRETISRENIKLTKEGYYAFVNHIEGLVTSGFKRQVYLENHARSFRFDNRMIGLMKKRYNRLYNDEQ